LAVAKRHGISELTIYKGCKRSSGFQVVNIKRLTQPTSGAINLSSGDLEQYPALAERAVTALVPRWAPDRDRFDG
jgi:hypothetical protein